MGRGRAGQRHRYDIAAAALASAGDTLVPVTLPNRRVTIALTGEDFDVVTGMQINQAGEAFYSNEYLTYANFAVTRKNQRIKLAGLTDLLKNSAAIWQNAWEDLNLGRRPPEGPNGLIIPNSPRNTGRASFFGSDAAM